MGNTGTEGDGHHRFDRHRPQGQGGTLGPQGQAQGGTHHVAPGHDHAAQPAAPVRDPEQDVHGGDGQQGQSHRLAEAGQRHQARSQRPAVGVDVDQGGGRRHHAAQSGGEEHHQGLALVRSPHQCDQAGEGEGDHYDGPHDLGGQVAVRVDGRRPGRAGQSHQPQREGNDGGERPGLGRARQAPLLGCAGRSHGPRRAG